jgi:hypothetical protein
METFLAFYWSICSTTTLSQPITYVQPYNEGSTLSGASQGRINMSETFNN